MRATRSATASVTGTREQQPSAAASSGSRRRSTAASSPAHGDPSFIAGCMLYWAEGSKRATRRSSSNADADLVEMFLRFLRSCYDVTDDRVALSVNCFLGNGLTHRRDPGLVARRGCSCPRSASATPAVNRLSSASKRLKGHILPYGTARVTVHSTFIVQSIYGAIQEYAGIDRPEWLDL